MNKPLSYPILTDEDVYRRLDMATAVAKMEDAFCEMADGTLVAPPCFKVDADGGGLVFTAGAANQAQVIGFQVYGTFPRAVDCHPSRAIRMGAGDLAGLLNLRGLV